jgi:Flp pilus assembly protein TadG
MTGLARLARCRRGLAALEFALLFPVMFLLFCGVVEISNLLAVDRKVVQAVQSGADLVTQEKTVDGAKLADIVEAVRLVFEPYPTDGLAFRISSVAFDAGDGDPRIAWQRTVGAFAPAGSADPLASAEGLGLPGESVVIVDLAYRYRPIFAGIVPSDFAITELAAARPRRVRAIACNAAGC